MTGAQPRGMFVALALLWACAGRWGEAQSAPQLAPADLVRAVIGHEIQSADPDASWKYLAQKEISGRRETREIVETSAGSIDRVVAVAGQPLTDVEQLREAKRILRITHSPEDQHRISQARQREADECRAFLQLIPEVFLFQENGRRDSLIDLRFQPNPRFQASSREAKVLHAMQGELWIDGNQQRLVGMSGQLIEEVKFGAGLLGHLEKGGQFQVRRTELAPGQWEIVDINVNMRGKALLFKNISVEQSESREKFERLPNNLTLPEAAGLLLGQKLLAAKH
jgi:hypothetical protein